jgi:glucan biosynthesis protein C
LVVYIAGGRHGSYWSISGTHLLHVGTIAPVVAWFIEALLLFTLLYVAWRVLSRPRSHVAERSSKLPSDRMIYGFIFALGLVSLVVRIWWPLGWWLQPFNLEVAHLPQYLRFYVLGCIAYRRNWFAQLSPQMGRKWWSTTIVAILSAIPFMTLGGGAGTQLGYYSGGFH